MVTTSRLVAVAASLAAGLALAACSATPGAAAVVDGQKISEDYLAEATTDITPYLQSEPTPAGVLASLIQARVVIQVASERGVGVSEDEAIAFLDELSESNEIESDGEYAPGAVQFARMALATQELQGAEGVEEAGADITERLAAADVTVNPRYGEWDGQGSITPITPEWLVSDGTETAQG